MRSDRIRAIAEEAVWRRHRPKDRYPGSSHFAAWQRRIENDGLETVINPDAEAKTIANAIVRALVEERSGEQVVLPEVSR